jgi:SAM-dependent methyltransferase
MRALVGTTDPSLFDNPSRGPVFAGMDPARYPTVLDFGCGCGRLARKLIQQQPQPERYVGLDLHRGMIDWCNQNLAPCAPTFEFQHHDVFYEAFNPGKDKPLFAPLPFADGEFSLVVASSVFTHLTQPQAESYMAEMSRVLAPGGALLTTWFLFDKHDFPMMQANQNTLFINEFDIRNAVIYDRGWLLAAAANVGLILFEVRPPGIRGFQWELRMTQPSTGSPVVELPADVADRGRMPPPDMPANASAIGLSDRPGAATSDQAAEAE